MTCGYIYNKHQYHAREVISRVLTKLEKEEVVDAWSTFETGLIVTKNGDAHRVIASSAKNRGFRFDKIEFWGDIDGDDRERWESRIRNPKCSC